MAIAWGGVSGKKEVAASHLRFKRKNFAVRRNQSEEVIRGVIDPFIWAASLLEVSGLDLNLCL